MQPECHTPMLSLEQTIHRIFATRRITRLDQHLLMTIAHSIEAIAPQEQVLINRVFDALQRGALRIVD
jgi:hypothetical protein